MSSATAQMVTTTQVGCGKGTLRAQLAAERKAGQELIKMHREAVDTCNREREKLAEARKLLFAVHPFCEAWACFDLADDIKGFLEGHPRKEDHEKKEAAGSQKGPTAQMPEVRGGP